MIDTRQSQPPAISQERATRLLETLCTKYGFCLPPLWQARLTKNPPHTVEKFVDTVFHAEGLDPVRADSALYSKIRGEVRLAFEVTTSERRDRSGSHD